MVLQDYDYIDKRRLDIYVEQISAESELDGKTLSKHEKATSLLDYLRANKQLEGGRIRDASYHGRRDRVFQLEICNVVSIVIPENKKADPPFSGLGMWVSVERHEEPQHLLLLLRDFRRDDVDRIANLSAFSVLAALRGEGYDVREALVRANIGPFATFAREERETDRERARSMARGPGAAGATKAIAGFLVAGGRR